MIRKTYFHYTSIEVLALVLESKQFKFSRLDKVNDLTEAETKDFGKMGHIFFVNCWTSEMNESIPFWNMYTNEMRGVRIELPFPMLTEHSENFILKDSIFHDSIGNTYLLGYSGFNQVRYINESSVPQEFFIEDNEFDQTYKLNPNIGSLKKEIWKFESEWRYKIQLHHIEKKFDKEFKRNLSYPKIDFEKSLNTPDELFFEINPSSFEEMKIRLGPRTTKADKIIVNALICKFNPNAILETSELEGIIR